MRASEGRYQALFEAIDEGFCLIEVRLDAPDQRTDYRVVEANPAFYERTGFPQDILGRWLREAAPELEEHWYEIYGAVARTGEPKRFEENSDSLGRWFDVYAFRIGDPWDHLVAVLFNDISERKRHEEHTQLLVREVNHRCKNLLTVVQAIARQTAPAGSDDFLVRFGDRLQALSAEQDLLVRNSWKSVPIADLVDSQLAHFSDLIGERIEISGPSLSLTPSAAQALGMAFHELATNAAKYGALSNGAGKVAIAWSVESDERSGPRFSLSWEEKEGPPVAQPEHTGFGSTVTSAMVRASTGGDVSTDYAVSGLSWRLSCPVERVLDVASS